MPHRLKLKTPAEITQTLPARPKPIDNKGKLPDLATPYLDFLTSFHVAEAVAEFIPFTYEQAILHNRRLADEYPETAQHFGLSARRCRETNGLSAKIRAAFFISTTIWANCHLSGWRICISVFRSFCSSCSCAKTGMLSWKAGRQPHRVRSGLPHCAAVFMQIYQNHIRLIIVN